MADDSQGETGPTETPERKRRRRAASDPPAKKTAYKVLHSQPLLRLIETEDGDPRYDPVEAWVEIGELEAHGNDAACQAMVQINERLANHVLVATPARSWKPGRVPVTQKPIYGFEPI